MISLGLGLWSTTILSRLGFSPSALFANGEVGVWYDPSPETTFTDTAGTTPATVGDAVARINDLSGNGHHATQGTTAARPILARVPARGRANLLTRTEEFDNAAWAKTAAITITPNAVAAPDGTLTADLINSPGFNQNILQSFVATSTTHTVSTHVRAGSTAISEWVLLTAGYAPIASTSALKISGPGSISTVGTVIRASGLTSEWTRFSATYSGLTVGATYRLSSYVGQTNPGASLGNIYFWGAQLELGSTATAYQKVVSTYDVTEAGQADNYFLWFDGVDDSMVTPTITPGIDKVQVFAGVRKLAETTAGVVVELGVDVVANNGSFVAYVGGTSAANGYGFQSRGDLSLSTSAINSGYSPPSTVVYTGRGDISGDLATLRIDGTQVAQSTVDQGTGNYLAYPMYIGSRAGTSLRFNGHLHQLITRFGANLDANVITQTEKYVSTKTAGVEL